MDPSDQLALQANLRAEVEDQRSALAGVGDFLATIRDKETRVLAAAASARAEARRVIPSSSPSSLSPPSAAATLSPIDGLHAEGNAAIAAGDYPRAITLYSRVIASAPAGSPVANAALANRALAHLKTFYYRAAIVDATEALRNDVFHTKSWMRRAAARNALGQHELASRDLEVARALEPSNRIVMSDIRKTAESAKAASRRTPDVVIPVVADVEMTV